MEFDYLNPQTAAQVFNAVPGLAEYEELIPNLPGVSNELFACLCFGLFSPSSELVTRFSDYDERLETACGMLGVDQQTIEHNEAALSLGATRVFAHVGDADFMVWYATNKALQQMCKVLMDPLDLGGGDMILSDEMNDEDFDKNLSKVIKNTLSIDKEWAVYDKKASLGVKIIALRREIRSLEKELFAGQKKATQFATRNADKVLDQRGRRVRSKGSAQQALNSI